MALARSNYLTTEQVSIKKNNPRNNFNIPSTRNRLTMWCTPEKKNIHLSKCLFNSSYINYIYIYTHTSALVTEKLAETVLLIGINFKHQKFSVFLCLKEICDPVKSVICSIPVIYLFGAYIKHQIDYKILLGFFQPYELNTDFTLWICIVCGIDVTHVVIEARCLGRQFHVDWGTETPEGLPSFIQEGKIHHVAVLQTQAEEIIYLCHGTVIRSAPDFKRNIRVQRDIFDMKAKNWKYDW